MKRYNISGFGCLFFTIILVFIFSLILRLAGFVIAGLLGNPYLLLFIILIYYFGRHRIFKEETPKKSSEIEYEFIDEEKDPED